MKKVSSQILIEDIFGAYSVFFSMKRMRSDDIVNAGRIEYIESEIFCRGGEGFLKLSPQRMKPSKDCVLHQIWKKIRLYFCRCTNSDVQC